MPESTTVYDYAVIGGGIVGLATAMSLLRERPGSSLIVLEKEDGVAEAAIFPGELPERPEAIFDPKAHWQVRAPRFRPPLVAPDAGGRLKPPPQIRLDRALEFLIGDKLA